MMAGKRPVDSGRRDSQGRVVKVGEGQVDGRADAPPPTFAGVEVEPPPRGSGRGPTNFSSTVHVLPCGCSLTDGRCGTHGPMMNAIYQAWNGDDNELAYDLWSVSDGYGEPGFVPPQGYDWSGIRDSSTEAIEAMHKVIVDRQQRSGG